MRNRRETQELVWECALRLLDATGPLPGPERTALFWRIYDELLRLVETCGGKGRMGATDGRR